MDIYILFQTLFFRKNCIDTHTCYSGVVFQNTSLQISELINGKSTGKWKLLITDSLKGCINISRLISIILSTSINIFEQKVNVQFK